MKKIISTVKGNKFNLAAIIGGGIMLAAGIVNAIGGGDNDEKYEPGEISEALSEDDNVIELEPSEKTTEE